jgi:hypothetical protein
VSTWQDLVTASLIGTERAAVPDVAVAGVPRLADAPADDPAVLLLDRAALLTVARRGGRPAGRAEPTAAAGPDPARAVTPAAGRRLARMLGGEYPELLTQWLAAAVTHGLRPPAPLLPALLDRARRVSPADPELRLLTAEAGGARARWLAGLNRDWTFVTAYGLPDQDAWRLGGKEQRRGYLTALRARDPSAARELVAASWESAGPERVMFLSVLAGESAGLSLADEPLLEAALGDRDAEVRARAAALLARLPGSALGQRLAERALGCLSLHQGSRGMRLIARPPVQSDAAMRREGITPGSSTLLTDLAGRAHLMVEVLARTPLRTWTEEFGRTPEQILALPSGGWAPVLFTGWAGAAVAQRDQEWMAALMNWALAGGLPGTPADAEALGRLARAADPALAGPGTTASLPAATPPAVRGALGVLRFRYQMLKELEDDDSAG